MRKKRAIIFVFIICTVLSHKLTAKSSYEGVYSSTGFGIGKSYGGLGGIRLQFRFGGIVGAGLHVGAGYFPNAPLGISVGFKLYAYKGLYLNAQYGTVGIKDVYSYTEKRTGMWTYSRTVSSQGISIVYGSSFLVGEDVMFGKKKKLGINVAAGIASPFDSDFRALAIDLGFLIRI